MTDRMPNTPPTPEQTAIAADDFSVDTLKEMRMYQTQAVLVPTAARLRSIRSSIAYFSRCCRRKFSTSTEQTPRGTMLSIRRID